MNQNVKFDGLLLPLPWKNDTTRISLEEVFSHRLATVAKVCRKYGGNSTYGGSNLGVPMSQFRWSESTGLTVCFVAKVGTSTWLRLLLNHSHPQELLAVNSNDNITNKNDVLHVLVKNLLVVSKDIDREEKIHLADNSSLIMTVRHPFERIAAAYSDKISECHSDCQIDTEAPFFRKFILRVISDVDRVIASGISSPGGPLSMNVHWRPYYMNCGPCNFHYRYIVKLDNYGEEVSYILKQHAVNFESIAKYNSRSSSDYAFKLLKTLPVHELVALYRTYKIDFEMFGYSVDDYL